MSKILVTGSHGFIGSHLVNRLLEEGHNIIGIDNFDTGKRTNLRPHRNLATIEASILDDEIEQLFEGVDVVFHLAALTRPQKSFVIPRETTYVNVDGTLKILMHCVKYKVGRVIFTSSSSLYGTQDVYPLKEEFAPKPESPYGLTKWVGEQYCKLFGRMYGLQVNCIRPFNVYGARQNKEGGYAAAVPSFIDKLKNHQVAKITGDGEQSRDFTYVEDIVDLLIRASVPLVYGESFNGGAGRNVTVNYVYRTIAKLMNKDTVEPVYVDPISEPKMTLADNSKARRLLGWVPQYSIEEGLIKTIKEILSE